MNDMQRLGDMKAMQVMYGFYGGSCPLEISLVSLHLAAGSGANPDLKNARMTRQTLLVGSGPTQNFGFQVDSYGFALESYRSLFAGLLGFVKGFHGNIRRFQDVSIR